MSTRANIIVKDSYNSSLIFYRHSDGYPEGVLPTLTKFVDLMKDGSIRNNLSQGAGWLIVLGAIEYNALPKYQVLAPDNDPDFDSLKVNDWKVGAYEPTDCIHGDIEHLYLIDMDKFTIDEIEIAEQWQKSKVIKNHYTAKG